MTTAKGQGCIYPADSILEDYMCFARTVSEAADCFLIGSVMPVSGAILARSVWIPWAARSLYPNLFSILCGKPGDRKTTTIDLNEDLAKSCLPPEAFIPKDFSPEALFDEYDVDCGGRPDKLLLVDDANITLTDWQSPLGQGNAVRFLSLYDCRGFLEAYRRNKQKGQPGSVRRVIPETSTSVLFGATFNIAKFQNQAVQAGLERRFLYYVAEKLGRIILRPRLDQDKFKSLCYQFNRLNKLSGPFKLTPEAETLFDSFQKDNRALSDKTNPLDDDLLSRLATTPTHVLKVAMIFEACRSAKQGSNKLDLQEATLQLAIDHVAECEKAVTLLDTVVDRPVTNNTAELMLAAIREEQGHSAQNGEIVLTKTWLTRRFANNGNTRSLTNDKLYGQVIPYLTQRGEVRILPKQGKTERYAFLAE